jgi:glycosyltransferase involved in cell wall biosynthesis
MARIPAQALAALREELAIAPGDFVVVMVARLLWQKGVREFAAAAAHLRKLHPGIRFVLVAPPEDAGELAVPEAFVRDLERQGILKWLGFRKDVRELYALADVAVLPSYYKEGGYPRTLLEPMALGKPVIAADTDDCRGPVRHGENGFLVPPRDAAALAARIEDLFNDPVLRGRFGACSLEIMREEFDDRVVGRQVLAEIGLQP